MWRLQLKNTFQSLQQTQQCDLTFWKKTHYKFKGMNSFKIWLSLAYKENAFILVIRISKKLTLVWTQAIFLFCFVLFRWPIFWRTLIMIDFWNIESHLYIFLLPSVLFHKQNRNSQLMSSSSMFHSVFLVQCVTSGFTYCTLFKFCFVVRNPIFFCSGLDFFFL